MRNKSIRMPGTKSTEDLPPTLLLFHNKSIVMPDTILGNRFSIILCTDYVEGENASFKNDERASARTTKICIRLNVSVSPVLSTSRGRDGENCRCFGSAYSYRIFCTGERVASANAISPDARSGLFGEKSTRSSLAVVAMIGI